MGRSTMEGGDTKPAVVVDVVVTVELAWAGGYGAGGDGS